MKIKKHLLFVCLSLKVGGIERALVEQINALDFEMYDVDLFLFYKGGEYLQYVSPKVRVMGGNVLLSSMAMTKKESKKSVLAFLLRTIAYFLSKIFGNRIVYSFIFHFVKLKRKYDVAISYFHDGAAKGLYYGCNLFVLNSVEATRKVSWMHSDCMLCDVDGRVYSKYDAVVNVSLAMKQKFDNLGLINKEKSFLVYNRFNENEILRLSNGYYIPDRNHGINIITVGRLEKYKSTMELLQMAYKLKEASYLFTWYFVGTGCLSDEAKSFVNEKGLSEYIVFTGQIANPYPYIKQADLFVSGSISETFGLSILEALILGTPVIAYRYEAINEVVQSNVNGIVVDSFDNMYFQIVEVLTNQGIMKDLIGRTKPLCDYNKLNQEQFKNVIDS